MQTKKIIWFVNWIAIVFISVDFSRIENSVFQCFFPNSRIFINIIFETINRIIIVHYAPFLFLNIFSTISLIQFGCGKKFQPIIKPKKKHNMNPIIAFLSCIKYICFTIYIYKGTTIWLINI